MAHLSPSRKKALVLEKAAGLPPDLVSDHLRLLDADYFNEFSVEEILGHLEGLARLTRNDPFLFEFSPLNPVTCGLTVIGEDLPGFFAALSGLLASYDFDIRLGKVFTYLAREAGPASSGIAARGKIIDYLMLEHSSADFLTPAFQDKLKRDLSDLVALLQARQHAELRADLYRRIGAYLSRKGPELDLPRLPVEIQVDVDENYTVLTIRGTDRKALLFSLSNALSLQGVLIHKILTRSENRSFEDRIFITGDNGKPITDAHALDRLKVAIVLMERFMSTLPQASDYPAAIRSFNDFIGALMEKSGGQPDLPAYEDFTTLSSLAKILGAGPYLWEEMTKLPMPAISDLLKHLDEEKKPMGGPALELLLARELAEAGDYEGKWLALNRCKDYQLFRLEVVHLVFPHKTLEEFSREISELAEAVLDAALWLAFEHLRDSHGGPRIGGEACGFGLFAQGKLGGRELGYASDLEVQLVYAASGETSDPGAPLSNAEFFSQLIKEMRRGIVARREGIFELDLRLRPHGESGPLASNLEYWTGYYGPGGEALDYERQALIKLRGIAGTPGFADKVAAARDAVIYGEHTVPVENTLGLREKQVALLAEPQRAGPPGRINAKYAPGGLVEVEYAVQFLQLGHGRWLTALRQANTGEAMEALLEAGLLTPSEFEKLFKGYAFLRRLINALRMVRGHSRDLFVPPRASDEFLYLAKRMGYVPLSRFEPDVQLDRELRRTLQDVHAIFSRRYLGRPAPGGGEDSPEADLSLAAAFLDPGSTPEKAARAAAGLGVEDAAAGVALLGNMLATVREQGILCAVLVVAETRLKSSPDPESVLRHLGQYLEAVEDPDYLVRQMLDHPRLLEILIKVFGHSEFLTHILLREPEYLLVLGDPRALEKPKLHSEFSREISDFVAWGKNRPAGGELETAMEALRRYRNREYLRIGLRDIYLGEPLPRIAGEISQLSNALIEAVCELTLAEAGILPLREALSVIALGKLGGNELNYSSDIDIVFVYDPARAGAAGQETLEAWARHMITALSAAGGHGKMFRVDTNLRPWGGQGVMVASLAQYEAYFRDTADGWEMQAWLKARPVAGDDAMGRELIRRIQAVSVSPANREKVERSMRKVRLMGLEKLKQENRLSSEVKLGPGGIRTIEFYVQYLQIQHGHAIPELITGNTLAAMARLHRYHLLSHNYYDLLSRSYVFLRRIEHVLQLQGLQQRHELPDSPVELEKLAKRMGFEERLGQSASTQFREHYRRHMLTLQELSSVLFAYDTNLPETPPSADQKDAP